MIESTSISSSPYALYGSGSESVTQQVAHPATARIQQKAPVSSAANTVGAAMQAPSLEDGLRSALMRVLDALVSLVERFLGSLVEQLSGLPGGESESGEGGQSGAANGCCCCCPQQSAAAKDAAPVNEDTSAGNAAVSEEFLWKPISEKDRRLVILLPAHLTGKVDSVTVWDADGKVLEKGNYCGVANGGREHYRFTRKGGTFPDGARVELSLKDGGEKRITVKDTSRQLTRKISR